MSEQRITVQCTEALIKWLSTFFDRHIRMGRKNMCVAICKYHFEEILIIVAAWSFINIKVTVHLGFKRKNISQKRFLAVKCWPGRASERKKSQQYLNLWLFARPERESMTIAWLTLILIVYMRAFRKYINVWNFCYKKKGWLSLKEGENIKIMKIWRNFNGF